ncbi:hypothetical protein [Planomonospora venezuelensis]|uniref:Flagellar hook-associated protein FlgK n=1 Tax=Planomonospora venezuelensis TaxID=1999 RepID=A0A841CZZ6_PLAVE|nr:hypothetical protein [Planomonospora venezuelensis]MBB5962353.1 flagellar hook-associated protein FlgK [Planomonospora venezuelensis]GIN00734.1 hypothetical protein Pve01_23920 [Planomonospora venezuelensis]
MFRVLSPRRIAVAVAGAALVSMSAACGAGANTALCADAQKLFTDYSSTAAGAAGDLNKFNEANQKLSADLKALADKADGELASALNDFSATWGALKIDPNNPAAATTALQDLGTKAQQATTKLASACS